NGREKHRGVRDASGDHDIGAAPQRFRDGLGSEIRIGRNDIVDVDGLPCLRKAAESVAAGELANVVAGHHRDREPSHAQSRGNLPHAVSRGGRVGGAHVGDDPDASSTRLGQDRFHALLEQRIEAGIGIAGLRLLRECDGSLGQALEDDDVEIAAFDELDGRLDAVAGVSGAAADTQGARAHGRKTPRSTAAAVITSVAANSHGPVKRWCSPSSMPVSPTTRKVAGVSGLTGKPVVIWPRSAAWPTCTAGTPNAPATSAITGSTPR